MDKIRINLNSLFFILINLSRYFRRIIMKQAMSKTLCILTLALFVMSISGAAATSSTSRQSCSR